MSHFRNPAANTIRTLCPPWCWPRTPEDREGDERWVVLASAWGIRPSTPLGPDDFGKLILHYNAIMSLYCFYTLEVQGEEGFVVQFDRVQQCWKQPMGLQTAVGNPAVAFPVEGFSTDSVSGDGIVPDAPLLPGLTTPAQTAGFRDAVQRGPTKEDFCRANAVVSVKKFSPRCSIEPNKLPSVSSASPRSISHQNFGMDADSKVPKVLQEARDAQDVDSGHNIQAVQDIQNIQDSRVIREIQDIQDLQDGNDLDRNAAETTDNHSMISDLETTPAFARDLEPSNRSQFGEEGSDSPPTMQQNPHSILKDSKKRRVESPGEIGAAFEEAEESSLHPPASKQEETSNPQQGKAIENLTQAAPIEFPRPEGDGSTEWETHSKKGKALPGISKAKNKSELQQSSGGESKQQVGPKKENPSSREGTSKRKSTRTAPTELHQSRVDKPKRPAGRPGKEQSTAEKSTSKGKNTPATLVKQRASNNTGKQNMVQIPDEADEMDMDIVPKAEEKEHECMGIVQESQHEEAGMAQDTNAAADTAIEAEDEQKSWLSTCRVT
ncbi:MAG: hypothetical protein Q9199_003369 [Rusavskia elegans]